MHPSSHHWYIAGLGAIGSLANATAIANNLTVTPIVRRNSQSYCQSFIDLNEHNIALTKPQTLADLSAIEYLLVPLKSYDVLPFLTDVKDKLTSKAQVVLCHNGMGTIEQARELLPDDCNLYFCTSSHGVYKQARQAVYAGAGESLWQLVKQGNDNLLTTEQVAALLPQAKQTHALALLLWQKLIINCAINPLTAIYQVKNGQLAQAQFACQIQQVVKEAVKVAALCQVEIAEDAMLDKVYQVINNTAANTSSMLQDINAGNATEIGFITGYLVNQAKQHKLQVPQNQELLTAIKRLEARP